MQAQIINETTSLDALGALTRDAQALGRDIVEAAGVFDDIDTASKDQLDSILSVGTKAASLVSANTSVLDAAEGVEQTCVAGQDLLNTSMDQMRGVLARSQEVARWVGSIQDMMNTVLTSLREVEASNKSIAGISRQVNMLAVNAKIEAARAGEAGLGFAVVAEAINELSLQTASSASRITDAVDTMTARVSDLQSQATEIRNDAEKVLSEGAETDEAMAQIKGQVDKSADAARQISAQARAAGETLTDFTPAFEMISDAAATTADGIKELRKETQSMVDTSEGLLQGLVELGGSSEDQTFIEVVQKRAMDVSAAFAKGLEIGKISEPALFDRTYSPIAGTNPGQLLAPFTAFTDDVLPAIQEPVLEMDPRVVFCAAVDQNGYLPTHNLKFAQPQGNDPVWNAANSRNRRLFDDRVGLKAGRNERPFLLQVYRRDMGGGTFVMMKDVSAPIVVNGRHWGGLRLAFRL